jgi:hypothetical protein
LGQESLDPGEHSSGVLGVEQLGPDGVLPLEADGLRRSLDRSRFGDERGGVEREQVAHRGGLPSRRPHLRVEGPGRVVRVERGVEPAHRDEDRAAPADLRPEGLEQDLVADRHLELLGDVDVERDLDPSYFCARPRAVDRRRADLRRSDTADPPHRVEQPGLVADPEPGERPGPEELP